MATVLGFGDSAGSDSLTITLTAAEPASSFVHVIHAAVNDGQTFVITPHPAALPSDSQAGTWSTAAGFPPVLGAISNGYAAGPPGTRAALQLGETAMRKTGAALGVGDTVTVTWDDGGTGPANMAIVAIVIAFDSGEYGDVAEQQYLGGTTPGDFVGRYYANGIINADMSPFDGRTLNWTTAFAGSLTPYPRDNSTLLAVVASYPAAPVTSYVPVSGSRIFQVNSSGNKLSIAGSLAAATALTAIEPGGTFPGLSALIMVGQYQFALGSVAPTNKCKKCGGMLGGVAVGSSFSRWI